MDTDAVSSPADLRDAPDLFGLALDWPKHDFGLLCYQFALYIADMNYIDYIGYSKHFWVLKYVKVSPGEAQTIV